VQMMAYIAPWSLTPTAGTDTALPSLAEDGEATISKSHEAFAPNTAPSRRGRHQSAAAGRSDKADLGFPLA
jgi:hypothetical protein